MVLDSVRTLFIYVVSLALRWQVFYWLQVIFFFLFLCCYMTGPNKHLVIVLI